MAKSTTPSFVTTIPIKTDSYAQAILKKRFFAAQQQYNALLGEALKRLRHMCSSLQSFDLLCSLLTSREQPSHLSVTLVSCETFQRSPWVRTITFAAQLPNLHRNLLVEMDFAVMCPLVPVTLPLIWFLFVSSQLCSTLPSDPASQQRPCALLSLPLH